MSGSLPMFALVANQVKYSPAYSTGRELMLEPRYGCAEEALLRREAARSASEGPARGRAGACARVVLEEPKCISQVISSMGSDPIVSLRRRVSERCRIKAV